MTSNSTSLSKSRRLLAVCGAALLACASLPAAGQQTAWPNSTDTFVTHIPYRGSAPALQDVMAGQADFVFDPGVAFPHIKAGKVKLLGVASDRKSPFFPDAR